jgi:HAD superfamily hydrolase (TIGR01549 family)
MLKNLLFDFDGVILDSMPIRDRGFLEIFRDFPPDQVARLMAFHEANGGISRYVKIRWFHEQVLGKSITDAEVQRYADQFSEIMRRELTNRAYLITDTVEFLASHATRYRLHIVSGSDQNELRFLTRELGVADYFITIEGSPTPKPALVAGILTTYGYAPAETALVGDTFNDYDAARENGIGFYGYNNPDLIDKAGTYIYTFKTSELCQVS